jgi:predicted aspartyl protease
MQPKRQSNGKLQPSKENGVGRFNVPLEVANFHDLAGVDEGRLQPDQVRRVIVRGVVDSGANKLILPADVAKQLGLRKSGKVKVTYGHDQSLVRSQAEGVHVTLLGRGGVFNAVLEPGRDTALIGAIVLEDLDLLVDCGNQRLLPRDPKYMINEVG